MPLFDQQEVLESLEATSVIINHWPQVFRDLYGDKFPVNYTSFDTETTGFSRKKDLIVEWGHCIVRDRKIVDRINIVINWFDSDLVPNDWISSQLARVARKVQLHTGHTFHITEKHMREKGVPVSEVLPWMYDFLSSLLDQGEMLVSHNGWNFDIEMMTSHFKDFMDKEFVVPANQMFDTGAIEKASQAFDDPRLRPQPGDTLKDYFVRIARWPIPGVKWNLDTWCMQKYKLKEKYGADASEAHQAGYDAWLLHLLMEEFHDLVDSDTEPVVPVIPSAPRTPNPSVTRTHQREQAPKTAQPAQKRIRGQRNR